MIKPYLRDLINAHKPTTNLNNANNANNNATLIAGNGKFSY